MKFNSMRNSQRLMLELEKKQKMEKCILSLLDISNSSDKSEEDIIQLIIDDVTELTNSDCGYLHLFNADENTIELKVWSKNTLKHCTAVYDNHYPLENAGIWADCARLKRPVIHNDYESIINKKGLPEGHFKLIRHMSVPVIENDKVVVIIGVGNKLIDYDELDVKQMEVITQNLWRLIKNKRYEAELKKDHLTQVLNRKEFEKELEKIVKTNLINTLAYVDVDNFKIINDSGGHIFGDTVLKEISNIFKNNIRKHDIIGRLGGDEFGIIFVNCDINNAKKICENIRNQINDLNFELNELKLKISISIGLSLIGDQSLLNADSACYLAKDAGKNQIKIYEIENTVFKERKDRVQWASKIPFYINNDKLRLYIQPIKHINTINMFKTDFYEVLLRIEENDQITVPGQFLGAAEKYNLSINVDKWVISNIIDILPYLNCTFSINLSSQSIGDSDFFQFLKKEISRVQTPEKLCFEITESAAINNHDNAINLVKNLKAMGCKFALDDFGSGFSSFSYLKEFPVNFIKIDGMFVKDIAKDEFSKLICKSISDIAKSLAILTIAEFIEDEECLNILRTLHINYGQGFYFSKPFSIDLLLNQI